MRTVRVVIPPPFLLSTTAIWIYLAIIAVLCTGFMIRCQHRLRRNKKAGDGESDTEESVNQEADKQTETAPEAETEQEVTDEYEIIEE
jgi:cytochrome c-type biogenesis protein CcmH/NrfF